MIKSPALPALIIEHGLEYRYRRGDVTMDHRAPEVDNPNKMVFRPMAVSAVDRLYDKGSISRVEHIAALKYQELREIEVGARWVNGEQVGRLAHWQKGHPTITQINASETLRKIHYVLGPRARTLISLLIIQNMGAGKLAMQFAPSRPEGEMRRPLDDRAIRVWIQTVLYRVAELLELTED